MQPRKRATKSTRASSEASPGDYSIYLPIDRIKISALPFRIGDYGEAGIFTEAECKKLAVHHGLELVRVVELSVLVGNALDAESYVSFVRISRSRVQERLAATAEGKRLRAKPLLDNIDVINQVFAALSLPYFVPLSEGQADTAPMAGAPEAIWGTVNRNLSLSKPHRPIPFDVASKVLVPDDYRTEADDRRRAVVEQCCYIALDIGWALSFTTDPSLQRCQRTGRLVNLIKDVVQLATDPSLIISGDTIVGDLDLVRHRISSRVR